MHQHHHYQADGRVFERDVTLDEESMRSERASVILIPAPEHVIAKRAASSTCTPGDTTAQCAKPLDSTSSTTLPITLGAVIPLVTAICLFIYLHRRHVRKLRNEDKNDKTISLDFGLGPGSFRGKGGKKGKFGKRGKVGGPEMLDTSQMLKGSGRTRGMSMYMDVGSPYLLPPEVHDSRSSLHSLTRTLRDDDKYQPVNFVRNGASTPDSPFGSVRSFPMNARMPRDDASEVVALGKVGNKDTVRRSLVSGTSRSLVSDAQTASQTSDDTLVADPVTGLKRPMAAELSSNSSERLLNPKYDQPRDSYIAADNGDMRRSHLHLAGVINSRDSGAQNPTTSPIELPARTDSRAPTTDQLFQPTDPVGPANPPTEAKYVEEQPRDFSRPLRKSSATASNLNSNRTSRQLSNTFTENQNSFATPPSPIKEEQAYEANPSSHESHYELPALDLGEQSEFNYDYDYDYTHESNHHEGGVEAAAQALEGDGYEYQSAAQYQDGTLGVAAGEPQRLSMGFRPLPPDDPSDTPEQRANRIRSFYKEYFGNDDRQARDHPPLPPLPTQPQSQYYEDYGQEYMSQPPMQDGVVDPETGYFYPAPPPAPYAAPMSRRAMTPPPRAPPRFRGASGSGRPRHQSSASSGGYYPPGPRAMSSASGNINHARGRRQVQKVLPPPSPLKTLPTPHMMKDDASLFDASMFAPPPTHRDIASGSRSSSPLGESRAYKSPKLGHNPLVSSFDELPVMPSPHQMRRSGTFTGLDFALPPRIKAQDNMSDAGSIRSNRTGISQTNVHAIRNGAYRISRLPEDMVPKKSDMANNLRPTWDMRHNMT